MAIRLKDRVEANVRQSDKVNNSLSIQLNSGTATVYNGSAAKSINITPAAIGAPTISALNNYLPLTGGTLTGTLNSRLINIYTDPLALTGAQTLINIKTLQNIGTSTTTTSGSYTKIDYHQPDTVTGSIIYVHPKVYQTIPSSSTSTGVQKFYNGYYQFKIRGAQYSTTIPYTSYYATFYLGGGQFREQAISSDLYYYITYKSSGAVGSTTTPVYVNSLGEILACTDFTGLVSVAATQPTDNQYSLWVDTSEDTADAMRADAIKYKTFSIETSAWSGSGPYTWSVAANGVTENTAIINLTLDAESQTHQKAQLDWETSANTITLSTAVIPTGTIAGYLIATDVTVI